MNSVRRSVGALLVAGCASLPTTARADEAAVSMAERDSPLGRRAPAAEIEVVMPPDLPPGWKASTTSIDAVTRKPEDDERPTPIAPGKRSVSFVARSGDTSVEGTEDVEIADGRNRFTLPRLAMGRDGVGVGIGVILMAVGLGGIGAMSWAFWTTATEPVGEYDFRGLSYLLEGLATVMSATALGGGMALTIVSGVPHLRWGDAAPVVVVKGPVASSGVALELQF